MDDNTRRTNDGTPLSRDENTATGELGGAVGGVSGVVAGAAIGSAGGPVGTVIGGIAGAVGGWWAGKAVGEAATTFSDKEDASYREAYDSRPDKLADRAYEDVRPAYQIGYIASQNPDYNGKNFEEIETDLQHGWSNDLRARHGDWTTVKPFAEEGYTRRSSVSTREATNRIANSAENLADRAANPESDLSERRF